MSKGPDLNFKNNKGDTALKLATKKGNYYIVKKLLENGAKDNIEYGYNGFYETAFYIACNLGNEAIIKLFIDYDINIGT